MRSPFSHARISSAMMFCLLLFIVGLVSCSRYDGSNGNENSAATRSATKTSAPVGTATPVARISSSGTSPGTVAGPQPCPVVVRTPSYWDPIIPIQADTNQVESVTCAYLMGKPSLQALVTVRSIGSGALLDVYVYDDITGPRPLQVFRLLGLYQGNARISVYNTVLTAEVDQNSSVNKRAGSNGTFVPDLFREFRWSGGPGTLVPIAFPGIFPDLTRYQAEDDQRQVDQGHQPWKRDAVMTANALASAMLQWPNNAPATLVSGGRQYDLNAVVSVRSPRPGSGGIQVKMSRLEGNTNSGIWIVTGVTGNGLSITTPPPLDRLSSPVTVEGTGNAFEGRIGTVTILDHTYTDIGHAFANGAIGMGNTTFSTTVSYTSSFTYGTQEGVVVLSTRSNADGSIAAAAMVKVLLT